MNTHIHTKKSKNSGRKRENLAGKKDNNDKIPQLAADTHTDAWTQLMQEKIVQDRYAASQRTCFKLLYMDKFNELYRQNCSMILPCFWTW